MYFSYTITESHIELIRNHDEPDVAQSLLTFLQRECRKRNLTVPLMPSDSLAALQSPRQNPSILDSPPASPRKTGSQRKEQKSV